MARTCCSVAPVARTSSTFSATVGSAARSYASEYGGGEALSLPCRSGLARGGERGGERGTADSERMGQEHSSESSPSHTRHKDVSRPMQGRLTWMVKVEDEPHVQDARGLLPQPPDLSPAHPHPTAVSQVQVTSWPLCGLLQKRTMGCREVMPARARIWRLIIYLSIGELACSSMADASADLAGAKDGLVRPMMEWMSSRCRGISSDMLLSIAMSELSVGASRACSENKSRHSRVQVACRTCETSRVSHSPASTENPAVVVSSGSALSHRIRGDGSRLEINAFRIRGKNLLQPCREERRQP